MQKCSGRATEAGGRRWRGSAPCDMSAPIAFNALADEFGAGVFGVRRRNFVRTV